MDLLPNERIKEVAEGVMGLIAGLADARDQLGVAAVNAFLDQVPERGVPLWDRFKAFQKDRPGVITTFSQFVRDYLSQA